jgi:alkanesulfonate monooxygenase SsuD/methylene tetrahydromethanopterin reductase-like flavin-dependent oxidoreductase (luciferase family)
MGTLRGWLYLPEAGASPHPLIVMAHGWGAVKEMYLDNYGHADGWNAFPLPVAQLQHKLDVLRGHCNVVGRNFEDIRKQLVISAIVRPDVAQAEAELARFAAERQVPPEQARHMAIVGTPETIAASLVPCLDIGFDMFLLQECTPLDYASLRLFMNEVAPRLRAVAGK